MDTFVEKNMKENKKPELMIAKCPTEDRSLVTPLSFCAISFK